MFSKIGKIVDRAMNKLGYYKCTMPEGTRVSEKELIEMFGQYGSNEVFRRFLRDLCSNDVKIYFQASTDEDRRMIRGAYQRTNYFLALINKANGKQRKATK